MSMFNSDEEFEAYVAQQQQELAEQAGDGAAPQPPQQKGAMEQCNRVLATVIPVALAGIIGYFVWTSTPDRRSISHDPWDNILGTAAWISGRQYNANADTLTERLTLRLPGDKGGESDD